MKSLYQCTDAELRTRYTWSRRLVLGLLAIVIAGYALAFALAISDHMSDYPVLWVALTSIAGICLVVYLCHERISIAVKRRQICAVAIAILGEALPDSG